MKNNKNIKEYNSFEEFIFINKRYPTVNESKQLYDELWYKYLQSLDESDKKIAIDNERIENQAEAVEKIRNSTIRLNQIFKNQKGISSIYFSERWGRYSIYIVVTSLRRSKLYLYRANIPNFFEGWEIKLVPLSVFQMVKNSIILILFTIVSCFMVFAYISAIVKGSGLSSRRVSFIQATYSALWLALLFLFYTKRRKRFK